MTKRLLFIHRSCGTNLLRQGNVRKLLDLDIQLDDYNQNIDKLTDSYGNRSFFRIEFAGRDTTPKAYALFFNEANEGHTQLQYILNAYDGIIIKSCYPNNAIADEQALTELKECYTAIAAFFASHPDKTLGIVTTPPLVSSKTNPQEAANARLLAEWLKNTEFGGNVRVFDFYGRLADANTNTLRKEYRRLWTKLGIPDSHPNRKANRGIALEFARWLNKELN